VPTRTEQMDIDYTVEVFKFYALWRKQIEKEYVKNMKTFRAWDDNYEMYRRLYRGLGWRSTIYFPVLYANIETLTPKIAMAICGEPDFIDLEATEENDVQFEDPFKTILTKQWEDMKGFDEACSHVKQQLVGGWAFSKTGWWHDEADVMVPRPIVNLFKTRIGSKMVKDRLVMFDGPTVTALPPERIYWDPYAKTFNDNKPTDCMVVLDRYFTTKRYLQDRAEQKVWKNVGDVDYGAVQPYQEELEVLRKYLYRESQAPSAQLQLQNPWHKQTEIIELYGLGRDGQKRWCIVIANRKTLLFSDRNPFIDPPLIYTRNSNVAGQMTGTSEAEYGRPLNEAINTLRNYHIDNVNLGVNQMWKIDRNADIDQNQLISRPWGIVETNSMEGIEPLPRQPITQDAPMAARELENDIQTQSGVVDFLKGTPAPGFSDTATGIERLVGSANSRFAARIVSSQINYISDLFYTMIKLNQLNMTPTQAVRIAGKNGIKFTQFNIDNVKGRFDIRFKTANEQINKAVQTNQLLVMYNLFRGDPQIDQRALKHTIVRHIVPGLEGRLIMPDNEELDPTEEDFIMLNGGLVMPLPNEDHGAHVRDHMKFLQDHQGKMPDYVAKVFMAHIKAHMQMVQSVYQPSSSTSPMTPAGGGPQLNPMQGPGGMGGNGVGAGTTTSPMGAGGGDMGGGISDLLSAAGGGNVTQP